MRRRPDRTATWLASALFALYAMTALRGVAWQDSGIFQLRIAYRDLVGYFGLASSHPLYISLAHVFAYLCELLFDIEAPAAANLFSAICMATAVGILFSASLELTGSRKVSLLAAVAFGCSHMAWWLATIAESYPLSIVLIGLEALYAIRILKHGPSLKSTLCAAAFAGFGFNVHNLSLLSLPATAAAVTAAPFLHSSTPPLLNSPTSPLPHSATPPLPRSRAWRLAASLGHLVAFFAIWFAASGILLKYRISGAPQPAVFASDLLFGEYGSEVLGLSGVPVKITLANFVIMAFSFLSPFWFAAILAGVRRVRAGFRRPSAPKCLAAALLAVHAAFLLRYRIADQALFLLPTLFFSALASAVLLARSRIPVILAAATAACSVAVPLAANAVLHRPPLFRRIVSSRARVLPFRDEVRYWILPWKHDEHSAEDFAAVAIAKMNAAGDAALFADSTSAPPLMLRFSAAEPAWRLYTPWSDTSRFTADCISGKPSFAVSPVKGYCPAAALATGKITGILP